MDRNKKKILMAHYSFYGKDRWGRILPLARALARNNFDVTLITSSYNNNKGFFFSTCCIDNVKIILFKDLLPEPLINKGIGFVGFFARSFYSLTHSFDYVYSDCGELPNAGWPCKINQWLYKSVYISEWGDLIGKGGHYDRKPGWFRFFFGRYYLWAELYFRRSADIVMVLSGYMKKYAVSRGIPDSKILILPGGAPSDLLKYSPYKKSRHLFGGNVVILGYIGIGNDEIEDLIPLIKVIQEPAYKGRFKIVVCGHKISDHIIEKYRLHELLIECGWIDFYNGFQEWQYVDVFLLLKRDTGRSEVGWPNKLGDYLSIGRPVMLNLYGDVKELVDKYPFGFIQISFNRDKIAQQLDNLLSGKYDLESMGLINRAIAERVVSWDERINGFIRLLQSRK